MQVDILRGYELGFSLFVHWLPILRHASGRHVKPVDHVIVTVPPRDLELSVATGYNVNPTLISPHPIDWELPGVISGSA